MTGSYISVRPSSEDAEKIFDVLSSLDIKRLVAAKDYHVTIVSSPSKEADGYDDTENTYLATPKRFEIYPTQDKKQGWLVLELFSPPLEARFNHLVKTCGVEHDHDTFKPHITLGGPYSNKELSRVVDAVTKNSFLQFRKAIKNMSIELGKEICEPFQSDWTPQKSS